MSFFTLEESLDQYLVFGVVEIAAGAAIAPRSILGSDTSSQLSIADGVCIGSEVVIQARWGTLTIEAGVSIGSGVLIIGQGSIGAGTCVGSGSTLVNPQVAPSTVIAPNSLVGDMGRSSEPPPPQPAPPPEQPAPAAEVSPSSGNGHGAPATIDNNGKGPSKDSLARVYGQAHVNRMLDSLFPHRRPLDS